MKQGYKIFKNYLTDESGATAIEYALIAALVGLVAIAGVRSLAGGSGGLWNDVDDKVTNA